MRQKDLFRLFFVFYKKFITGKSKSSTAWFQYISIALTLVHNKKKLKKNL